MGTLRNERNHDAIMVLVKKPIISPDIPELDVISLLTPYAAHYICKQLTYRKEVSLSFNDDDYSYSASSSEGINIYVAIMSYFCNFIGNLNVTRSVCHCKFFNTMKIPCRHIFAVREKEEITLLSNEDIPEHWTMAYFKQVFGEKVE